LIELDIRHAASDFCKTRKTFSLSVSSSIPILGCKIISVIFNFLVGHKDTPKKINGLLTLEKLAKD
jgi:hypothetical protein